jgi:hypothetical protein
MREFQRSVRVNGEVLKAGITILERLVRRLGEGMAGPAGRGRYVLQPGPAGPRSTAQVIPVAFDRRI